MKKLMKDGALPAGFSDAIRRLARDADPEEAEMRTHELRRRWEMFGEYDDHLEFFDAIVRELRSRDTSPTKRLVHAFAYPDPRVPVSILAILRADAGAILVTRLTSMERKGSIYVQSDGPVMPKTLHLERTDIAKFVGLLREASQRALPPTPANKQVDFESAKMRNGDALRVSLNNVDGWTALIAFRSRNGSIQGGVLVESTELVKLTSALSEFLPRPLGDLP